MGPGFGQDLEKAAGCFLLAVIGITAVASVVVWELGKWIFQHLTIGWN